MKALPGPGYIKLPHIFYRYERLQECEPGEAMLNLVGCFFLMGQAS